jgi:hypothetical protein
MNSTNSKPSKIKKSRKLSKPFYGRKFYYSGNIAHIQAYLDKNKGDRVCGVKIFISPLTKFEKDYWGEAA